MTLKERISNAKPRQWMWFAILSVLWIIFTVWAANIWLVLLILLLFDIYITKFIPWTFWKKTKNPLLRKVMEWADAIFFALIAVYFINTFFLQNYQIPTSSLEKTLLVGDFLAVSKFHYGPRVPMTPLSFPLAQHTMPLVGGKSYIEKPQWKYRRMKGLSSVKRNDIVVFNFPAGDTVALNNQAIDYYTLCRYNANGRAGVVADKATYGDIVYRPVDRRDNYVKRCIGLPGETVQLKNDSVFVDGDFVPFPKMVQHYYWVQTDGTQISPKMFEELGVSREDYMTRNAYGQEAPHYQDLTGADSTSMAAFGLKSHNGVNGKLYMIPMTQQMLETMQAKPFVWAIVKDKERKGAAYYYPYEYETDWTRDTFGPLWIPKKGETVVFDTDVDFKVATYRRCIENYEGNKLEYRNGKVYINQQPVQSYTFAMDYYFMMGDNRHNSADSRVWGFVPEDHIVGQPMLVWLSMNKDKGWFSGKIRWNRLFKGAKK